MSISGLAVAEITAGGFLMFIGIQDVTVQEGVRSLLKGQIPAGKAHGSTLDLTPSSSPSGGSVGAESSSEIVTAASKYLGVKYKFGGTDPKTGFDCSGLVFYVLTHDLGLKGVPRTVITFWRWMTHTSLIPEGQQRAGDLAMWPGVGPNGHMGIVVDGTRMIHAPHTGDVVKYSPYHVAMHGLSGPKYLRVH